MTKKIMLIIPLLLIVYILMKKKSLIVMEKTAYAEIENGININNSIAWGAFNQQFPIPIGFSFNFLGKSFDSLNLETSGRLVFDDKHHYFADAFTEISFQDVGFKAKKMVSPITYKNETTTLGKVLIIQFKNVGFANDSLSRINFQVRLYENSNEFELIMGPSKINDFATTFVNGPYSAIYKVTQFDPFIIDYRLAIHGNAETPEIISDSGAYLNPFQYKLSTVPQEGRVYRFKTTLANLNPR